MSWSGNNQHFHYPPRPDRVKNQLGYHNRRKIEEPERYHEKKRRQWRAWKRRHNR